MFECPCEHFRLLLCWNGQHQCDRSLLSRILLPRRSGQCHTLRLQLYHGSLLPGRVRLPCALRCWVIPRQRGVYFLFTMPSWKVSWLICIYLHPHSEFEWVILHTCVYTFHVHNSVIFDSVKKNMQLTENDWKSVCCFETNWKLVFIHMHVFKSFPFQNYWLLYYLVFFSFSYCDPVEAAASLGINGTGVVTPTDCPQGHYCPLSTPSSTSYPCPIGTFNNDTKLQASTSCLPCTAGFYCEAPGKILHVHWLVTC